MDRRWFKFRIFPILTHNRFMLIDKFLIFIQHEKRYSLHTVTAYATDLQQFTVYLSDAFEIGPEKVQLQHIRSFIAFLMDDKMSPRAIARKLSTLRSFYKYLQRHQYITVNPMPLVKAPKVPKRLPVFVEAQKLDQLLNDTEIFGEGFEEQRDKTVIELLFGTGMRLSELLQLKDTDINHYEQTIKVLGKRSKERIIPLHGVLVEQLAHYVFLKNARNFSNKIPTLIVTNKGAAAHRALIYSIVHRYLSLVSTQDKRSPHVLRHSFASTLLDQGADLNAIKELLGHAGLAATQVYTHSSVERLKSIYKQAHPKA